MSGVLVASIAHRARSSPAPGATSSPARSASGVILAATVLAVDDGHGDAAACSSSPPWSCSASAWACSSPPLTIVGAERRRPRRHGHRHRVEHVHAHPRRVGRRRRLRRGVRQPHRRRARARVPADAIPAGDITSLLREPAAIDALPAVVADAVREAAAAVPAPGVPRRCHRRRRRLRPRHPPPRDPAARPRPSVDGPEEEVVEAIAHVGARHAPDGRGEGAERARRG